MKIAVSHEHKSDRVSPLFEETKHFKLYDIEDNKVICSEVIGTMGCREKEELVHLLLMFETDALICGELTDESKLILSDEAISVFSGCLGKSDDVVELMLSGVLIPV